ncbi:MAG: hypothetical protein LBT31_10625 [Synergistaceae bacterium]|nr:hypothetical protein [Synergistaceae bacterium]
MPACSRGVGAGIVKPTGRCGVGPGGGDVMPAGSRVGTVNPAGCRGVWPGVVGVVFAAPCEVVSNPGP